MASTSGSAISASYEPWARGMPSRSAASLAFDSEREAMATTSVNSPLCIAGITLTTPILAVLRMPQRTFRIVVVISG